VAAAGVLIFNGSHPVLGHIAYSLLMFTVSLLICKLVDFFSCSEYDWARKNFEFLLSVIELLFLSLTVEALQGKMRQNALPSGEGRSL